MGTIKVYYAKLNLKEDIKCFEFKSIESIRNFISDIVYGDKEDKVVYLLVIQDDVFVTENKQLVCELFDGNLNSAYPFYEGDNIFIQEYESFEEAYEVALTIKETSKLCYSK